jgi:hypothetical protein
MTTAAVFLKDDLASLPQLTGVRSVRGRGRTHKESSDQTPTQIGKPRRHMFRSSCRRDNNLSARLDGDGFLVRLARDPSVADLLVSTFDCRPCNAPIDFLPVQRYVGLNRCRKTFN